MIIIFSPAIFAGKSNGLFFINLILNLHQFRSVHLFWDKKVNYQGIGGYRYSSGNDFLNEMPDCFCTGKTTLTDANGCLYPGALDLTECLGKKNIIIMLNGKT